MHIVLLPELGRLLSAKLITMCRTTKRCGDIPEEGLSSSKAVGYGWSLLALFLCFSVGCSTNKALNPQTVVADPSASMPPKSQINVPADAIDWLKANLISFRTSIPGSDTSDLRPIKDIVGDARIVALGETTHGTHEFFQMKDRLFEFLVEEMGFNAFAMEASWPEANLINDYVKGGKGDPKQLLAGLGFWTWDTEEVLHLIEWTRSYNAKPGDHPIVSFYGFDMQAPTLAIQNVLQYLSAVDQSTESSAAGRYSCFRLPQSSYSTEYHQRSVADRMNCAGALQAVENDLIANEDSYEKHSSRADFAQALQSARIVVQAETEYRESRPDLGAAARDKAMADNVVWALRQAGPSGRLVLWAHNAHIAYRPSSMGGLLRTEFGQAMVTFGFDFYQGSFRAVDFATTGPTGKGVTEHAVGQAPPDSYEAAFHLAGQDRWIIDLRPANSDVGAAGWWRERRGMRSIGAGYIDGADAMFIVPTALAQEYDVIIYFDGTSPSLPIP